MLDTRGDGRVHGRDLLLQSIVWRRLDMVFCADMGNAEAVAGRNQK
jgi:hypothetical protein